MKRANQPISFFFLEEFGFFPSRGVQWCQRPVLSPYSAYWSFILTVHEVSLRPALPSLQLHTQNVLNAKNTVFKKEMVYYTEYFSVRLHSLPPVLTAYVSGHHFSANINTSSRHFTHLSRLLLLVLLLSGSTSDNWCGISLISPICGCLHCFVRNSPILAVIFRTWADLREGC